MKKIMCLAVAIYLIVCIGFIAYAETETDIQTKIENNAEITVQTEETVENILDEFEHNSDELQEKADAVIEKNSDNFIVKLFKNIMEAISKFLDAIFKIAIEATKIR